ncbi:uncharacterized protein LOC110032805 [Phalaenopsis equestris]|uniref:uncharacterized protein LOC110032805 n=1 Tax=Phalaenopsis equestris TaxID=78828 RepID=UPI0009E4F9F8|nr:uncharacterized protein LOC110032805 [Phalaenopsis equestris]
MVTKHSHKILKKIPKFTHFANSNNKIWLFARAELQWVVLHNHSQFIHIQLSIGAQIEYSTFIYASNIANNQTTLWSDLIQIEQSVNSLWILGGDLNCVASPSERRGGRPPSLSAMNRFNDFLSDAALFDLGYQDLDFTWRRGSMWERLDRMLGNSRWFQTFPFTIVSHLVMSGSDHKPLICSIQNVESPKRSPFRFQNMWTLQSHFIGEIAKKKVAAHLQQWNWNPFGNIHENLITAQNKGLNMEKGFQRGVNSEVYLHKANEELLMQINYSESFLKLKVAVTKFTEGDSNSSFYRACINFRRKNNMILYITDSTGLCLSDADVIALDAINYFQNLFNDQPSSRTQINAELLSDCQEYAHSLKLNNIPLEGEIKAALDSIDGQKVVGFDGFTANFYKTTWHIICGEFTVVVQNFFKGIDPLRYFTASTITLIP